tara:strand:- start:15559 stop:18072 length:2514 start_codon:yes stop_codon:yes gene_type:complete
MIDFDFYTDVCSVGGQICVRGYKNGRAVQHKEWYKPNHWVRSQEPTSYKTLDGHYVKAVSPGTMKKCREWLEERKQVANQGPAYGSTRYVNRWIGEHFPDGCDYDPSLVNVTHVDIEVKSDEGFPSPEFAAQPVTAITVRNNIDNIFYTWGYGDFKTDRTDVKYVKCKTEEELLGLFLEHWRANFPEVVTGWNIRFFDMPYLYNRILRVFGEEYKLMMSPWGNGYWRTYGVPEPVVELRGFQQLDYLDLFKKFAFAYGRTSQENFRLDTIANVVLGERKIDYSEHGSIWELYKNDHQKFIEYNIRDVELVARMEDKMGLVGIAMTIAYHAGVNYADSFGSVMVWEALIGKELRKQGFVEPPDRHEPKERQIEGAYVKTPQIGLHKWVTSFDLNSLYPHIIMQYNMSPETIVRERMPVNLEELLRRERVDIPKGRVMCATGQLFNNTDGGLLPRMVDKLYNDRVVAKSEAQEAKKLRQKIDEKDRQAVYKLDKKIATLGNTEMAIKILMNSLYGAMSNEFFRYYDIRIAEGITITGQLTIRWAEKAINEYLNKVLERQDKDYVIAIDTDSLYVNLSELVSKAIGDDPEIEKTVNFLDKVAEQKLVPLLNKSYGELKEYTNSKYQKMFMAREAIADKGVWTGKKRYILNLLDMEGVRLKEPSLKIMGIESVRSSTPQPCRQMIRDALRLIMDADEKTVQKFISDKRVEFRKESLEDIAFPRGMSAQQLNKYSDAGTVYKKGTPIHVRGALLYNHYLEEKSLTNKYQKINPGEKIKFVYLKMPNLVGENTIAFYDALPEEFQVHEQIDYDMQFEKGFLEPIKTILNAIGWEAVRTATLFD